MPSALNAKPPLPSKTVIHPGKQRYLCCQCRYQCVDHPTNQRLDQSTRELIDRLLPSHAAV